MLSSCVIPKGDLEELSSHDKEATLEHLELVSHMVHRKRDLESFERVLAITASDMQKQNQATDRKIMAFHGELARLSEEVGVQIAPLTEEVTKLESSLVDFKDSFLELARNVEALHTLSYNGEFMWIIPEVAQRLEEAQMKETTFLYCNPFFTSQFGYRLFLRLYLNGLGSGKGTHISFFIVVMKGQHDALLSWPFQHMVTMMLLDQDKRKDIVQAFIPEPSSPSYQRPKTAVNIPSGFPKFAPHSVLSNSSYVRNDTLYLKVIVNKTGLDQP